MDADDAASPLHVVVFPWLAFGHLLPGLQLADRLASRGHRVSFVSTPRNIARLRARAGRDDRRRRLDFVELTLPRVDGLPDGAEATADVPADKLDALWEASDGLAAPFSAFLDAASAGGSNKIDWVILDSLLCWAAASAADRDVPCVLMMPYSAASCAHFGVPEAGDDGHFPSATARRFVSALERCELLAVRSCVEFEPESVPLLSGIFGKPAVPIGLLPLQLDAAAAAGDGDTACTSWLDGHPPKSVVYVALGSKAPLTPEQRRELALGLELSGAPFLWALRKPHGSGGAGDDDLLPPGFEERTHGRGMVNTGWVPQLKILVHDAVGAYLTHCGYGSVIEGLRFGHPSYLERVKRAGVQVPRDGGSKKVAVGDGAFDRHDVAGAIRAAVVDEESKAVLAANARKLQEVVANAECDDRTTTTLEERTRGRGAVNTGWVPQLKILAHGAVGAYLTHRGYGSVIEGLRFGHPLVMLPLFLDHFPIASYLERVKRAGVQVPRDGCNGKKVAVGDSAFDRHSVARAVRAAVVDEESKAVLAVNARKLQEVVANAECDDRCIDAFIQQLRSYKEKLF
uniref:Glycosyltransferase N-terminal domain-containing protein n=1 Tax=Oryza meridionalis TaxID=40149 RepID=A0A0E0CLQ5_9ORYZ